MAGRSEHRDTPRSVVFAALDDLGRAEQVRKRLTGAIIGGLLRDGERLPSEAELATSLGVAVVTVREALEALRSLDLILTRRGREGGSFVHYDAETADRVIGEMLRRTSRLELRDLALHVGAITGRAAEIAVDRASDDDVASLDELADTADLTTAGGARRAVGRFHLELAALSQSPRLVHEEVRLQGESAPLLWLCLGEQEYRDRSDAARRTVIDAIRRIDAAAARDAVVSHIADALDWLIQEKAQREQNESMNVEEAGSTKTPGSEHHERHPDAAA